MMPLTQMNTHLMCPKCCPNVLGVPFLSMFNLPFSKAAGNTTFLSYQNILTNGTKNCTILPDESENKIMTTLQWCTDHRKHRLLTCHSDNQLWFLMFYPNILLTLNTHIYIDKSIIYRGRDRMVVGFTTTYAISATI
jgi:hypothetical protein